MHKSQRALAPRPIEGQPGQRSAVARRHAVRCSAGWSRASWRQELDVPQRPADGPQSSGGLDDEPAPFAVARAA